MLEIRGREGEGMACIGLDIVDADAVTLSSEATSYCCSSSLVSERDVGIKKSNIWQQGTIHATAGACHDCCSFAHDVFWRRLRCRWRRPRFVREVGRYRVQVGSAITIDTR